jgi:hypothetical protein
MTSQRGLFENRTTLVAVPLVSISLSVWSWLSIAKHAQREPLNIFGVANVVCYVFLLFGAASVAFRAPFWADRVVFGVIAAVALLIAIKAMVPLTFVEMLAVNVAKSIMWTIAAIVSLVVLVRGFRTSLSGGAPSRR